MSERVSRKIIVFGSPKTYGQFFDPNIQIFLQQKSHLDLGLPFLGSTKTLTPTNASKIIS